MIKKTYFFVDETGISFAVSHISCNFVVLFAGVTNTMATSAER